MKSKVSIIVPVYNCREAVDRCLERLTRQSLKEIEIVCVNDGSTDDSKDVLEEWAKKDKRIVVVSQKNGGLSVARNTGIANASSPYLMFCDSDDFFDERMCEVMVGALERENVDIVACGTQVQYDAHSEIAKSDNDYYSIKFFGRHYIDDGVTIKTDVSVCDKIFKASLISKYEIEFPKKLNNEDYYFYNAYMSIAKTIYFVDQKLYTYIRHDDSIMSENFEGNSYSPDHLLIVEKLFDFYKKNSYISEHVDLFWAQFSESYWFSYEHSAKKYHSKIQKIAKDFILKHKEKYPPRRLKIRQRVDYIERNDTFHKLLHKIRRALKWIYRKINFAYRQQEFINDNLKIIEQNIDELSERIERLKEE